MRALGGRWHLLRSGWRQILAFGVGAVAVPQLAFFYAVQHLSVGVALLLEYLGLVLVVAWQCLAGRRLPRVPTVGGIVLALVGLTLVLDLPALGRTGASGSTGSAWPGACSPRWASRRTSCCPGTPRQRRCRRWSWPVED